MEMGEVSICLGNLDKYNFISMFRDIFFFNCLDLIIIENIIVVY